MDGDASWHYGIFVWDCSSQDPAQEAPVFQAGDERAAADRQTKPALVYRMRSADETVIYCLYA